MGNQVFKSNITSSEEAQADSVGNLRVSRKPNLKENQDINLGLVDNKTKKTLIASGTTPDLH